MVQFVPFLVSLLNRLNPFAAAETPLPPTTWPQPPTTYPSRKTVPQQQIPVKRTPIRQHPPIKKEIEDIRIPHCKICFHDMRWIRDPVSQELVRMDCKNSCGARAYCQSNGSLEIVPDYIVEPTCDYCGMDARFQMYTTYYLRFYCVRCIGKFADEELIIKCIIDHNNNEEEK